MPEVPPHFIRELHKTIGRYGHRSKDQVAVTTTAGTNGNMPGCDRNCCLDCLTPLVSRVDYYSVVCTLLPALREQTLGWGWRVRMLMLLPTRLQRESMNGRQGIGWLGAWDYPPKTGPSVEIGTVRGAYGERSATKETHLQTAVSCCKHARLRRNGRLMPTYSSLHRGIELQSLKQHSQRSLLDAIAGASACSRKQNSARTPRNLSYLLMNF